MEKKKYDKHKQWRKTHYDAVGMNDKLVINLQDLSHTIRNLYEGRGSQKQILMVLEEVGGSITQQELTALLGIKPGSASEVLAKLEKAGYVKRNPNEEDRRAIHIELTEIGASFAAKARMERMERHAQMFSCLSAQEKKELLLLMERINADWEERYGNFEK